MMLAFTNALSQHISINKWHTFRHNSSTVKNTFTCTITTTSTRAAFVPNAMLCCQFVARIPLARSVLSNWNTLCKDQTGSILIFLPVLLKQTASHQHPESLTCYIPSPLNIQSVPPCHDEITQPLMLQRKIFLQANGRIAFAIALPDICYLYFSRAIPIFAQPIRYLNKLHVKYIQRQFHTWMGHISESFPDASLH